MKIMRKYGKGLMAALMGAALVGGALGITTASAEAVLGGGEGHAYDVRRGRSEKEGGSDTHVRRGMYEQDKENAPKDEKAEAPKEEQPAAEKETNKEPREYKYDVRRGMYQQEGGSDTEVRRGKYEQHDGHERGHL